MNSIDPEFSVPEFVMGFAVGILLSTVIWSTFSNNAADMRNARELKKQCELALPRNQNCEMSYVPVTGGTVTIVEEEEVK